eukprot:snap_masked-scaffold_3-processed-gene-4.29-mRNA-1 protein AED:1.00 eAED:1.00 QI:0/-1/0/0/-1/1/1/0/114
MKTIAKPVTGQVNLPEGSRNRGVLRHRKQKKYFEICGFFHPPAIWNKNLEYFPSKLIRKNPGTPTEEFGISGIADSSCAYENDLLIKIQGMMLIVLKLLLKLTKLPQSISGVAL